MGGLPNSVDEGFLKNFFAKYGTVSALKIFSYTCLAHYKSLGSIDKYHVISETMF